MNIEILEFLNDLMCVGLLLHDPLVYSGVQTNPSDINNRNSDDIHSYWMDIDFNLGCF